MVAEITGKVDQTADQVGQVAKDYGEYAIQFGGLWRSCKSHVCGTAIAAPLMGLGNDLDNISRLKPIRWEALASQKLEGVQKKVKNIRAELLLVGRIDDEAEEKFNEIDQQAAELQARVERDLKALEERPKEVKPAEQPISTPIPPPQAPAEPETLTDDQIARLEEQNKADRESHCEWEGKAVLDMTIQINRGKDQLRNGIIGMAIGGTFAAVGGGLLLAGIFWPAIFVGAGIVGGIGAILAFVGCLRWAVMRIELKNTAPAESSGISEAVQRLNDAKSSCEQVNRISRAETLIKGGGVFLVVGGACALLGGALFALAGPAVVGVAVVLFCMAALPAGFGLFWGSWGVAQWVANKFIK